MRGRRGAFVILHWTLKAVGDLEVFPGDVPMGLMRHRAPEMSLHVPEGSAHTLVKQDCRGLGRFPFVRDLGLLRLLEHGVWLPAIIQAKKALVLNDSHARWWWPQTWGRTVGVSAGRGRSLRSGR